VAIVKDDTGYTGYVNGVAGAKVALTGGLEYLSDQALSIGALSSDGEGPFLGYISDARITKGVALYTGNFTPSTAPLTATTGASLLCNFINAGIPDVSMQNELYTLGSTVVSTTVKKYGTGSLSFPFDGSYLNVVYPINWSTFGSYTIEFWCYQNLTTPLDRTFISTGSTDFTNFYRYANGRIAVGIIGTNEIVSAAGAVVDNTWQYITYTFDGTTTRIFVNGIIVASGTTNVYSNNSANLLIGVGAWWFRGFIDDLRITRGLARYTANFTPPDRALPTQ